MVQYEILVFASKYHIKSVQNRIQQEQTETVYLLQGESGLNPDLDSDSGLSPRLNGDFLVQGYVHDKIVKKIRPLSAEI